MKEDNNINKFLNLFGLHINDNFVYDNFNNKVSEVKENNGNYLININNDFDNLLIEYKETNLGNAFDFELENKNNKLYGYCYLSDNRIINSSLKLNLLLKNKKSYELRLNTSGKIFLLDIANEGKHDVFEINSENVNTNYHDLDGYITHYQESGRLNLDTKKHELEKFIHITDSSNNNDYKIETEVDENGIKKTYHIVYAEKNNNLNTQKGFLMQSIDKEIYDEIKSLRESLNNGDISLLDNSIKLILKDYNNYELFALLGIDFNNEFVLKDEICNAFINDKVDQKKLKFSFRK